MRFPRKRGSTSVKVRVFVPDSSSLTGAGKSGLTSASTNLVIEYMRELDSAVTSYAQSASNIEAQTTIGTFQAPSTSAKIRFKETPVAGLYELQFHDSATAFGTGDTSNNILINIRENSTTALNIGPNAVLIPLSNMDVLNGESNSIQIGGTAQTGLDLGGTWTATKAGYVDVAISSRGTGTYSGTPPTAAAIATAVWQDLVAGTDFTNPLSVGVLINALAKAAGLATTVAATKAAGAVGGLPVLDANSNLPADVKAFATQPTFPDDLTATQKASVTTAVDNSVMAGTIEQITE